VISGTCFSATPAWFNTFAGLGSRIVASISEVLGHSAAVAYAYPLYEESYFECNGSLVLTHIIKNWQPYRTVPGHCQEVHQVVYGKSDPLATRGVTALQSTGHFVTPLISNNARLQNFVPDTTLKELWDDDLRDEGWLEWVMSGTPFLVGVLMSTRSEIETTFGD
jgi:hypothetical protein